MAIGYFAPMIDSWMMLHNGRTAALDEMAAEGAAISRRFYRRLPFLRC
jgi:hypothetical protein